jgi:3',5'-nucleoside bisphosphate phosphatase
MVRIFINMDFTLIFMEPYDLHNHTALSKDGKATGIELIDLAAARGLKGIGICDHDEFPDEKLYAYAKSKGLKLALGIEFTCDKAHIIGYNMDLRGQDRAFLEERFEKLRNDYTGIARKIINMLRCKGIDITYEKVQEAYGKEKVQKLFVMKYLAEKLDMFPSWAEARKYLQKENMNPKDGDGVEKLDPLRAIEIIHHAGGYAIWAHPIITPEGRREKYFELFSGKIDAIEASYAYQENGYHGEESNELLESIIRKRLATMRIPASGGSDSHYPLKTYSDKKPIMPGDFGIDENEYKAIAHFFR